MVRGEQKRDGKKILWFVFQGRNFYVRDRSCRLRCSLRLKALLQNWHLYLRSGARVAFREDGVEAAGGGRTATLAPGILKAESRVWCLMWW